MGQAGAFGVFGDTNDNLLLFGIGSVGVNTQIETESATLLLRGAADIKKNAELERREGLLGVQVCEVGTQSCWELMSR